ncbi:hypothetical protein RND81_01G127700 [Saponaria officinalis]|uniref:Uncharacterized protein n=1 Tax=Saponaria officinalis TaxID=3572 RepID=A0AAW1N9Q0_SAPOF
MLRLRVLRDINGRIRGEVSKRSVCQQTNPTPDPAIPSTKPQVEVKDGSNPQRTTEYETETPKPPIVGSSPKLNHTEVGLPSNPNKTQTRKAQTQTRKAQTQPEPTPPEITCIGLDVSPWPDDDETDQKAQKKAQEEDKEYFKDHKASPLSEIEFADSRKPITQATDTNTTLGGIILFNDEQNDTAEDSLMRAMEIWKWNKMRGDPDSPHGRVLRQLRGEFW